MVGHRFLTRAGSRRVDQHCGGRASSRGFPTSLVSDPTDDLGTYQWFADNRPEAVRPDLFSYDRDGIPVVQYTAKEAPRYNPVTIAQAGLCT